MYNIHKYKEDVKMKENQKTQQQYYSRWLARHQQMKNKSYDKVKNRMELFLSQQQQKVSVYEDDHYKTWRYIKQFRDVEDQNKFVGFKAFQHKPNKEMDKYFTERQRKQINYLAEKSDQLVKSKMIPQQHISRSFRSQGPLNPKHTFRQIRSDKQYFQPRMRYTNITDKERHDERATSFDDKFQTLYKSFNMTKSKIGAPKVSPKKIKLEMFESTYSDIDRKQEYHYEAATPNEEETTEKRDNTPSTQLNSPKKTKSYFKTAKTMSLFGNAQAKDLMVRSQYDRKKDLTNLQSNLNNESFVKRPVL